ncbi:hypothetical protein EBZ39_17125 [bacterium]|nr:hypothetical protein [bacterium]
MSPKIRFSVHFHQRLLQRRGITLTKEELTEIAKGINREMVRWPERETEMFHVKLNHRNESFQIVYKPKDNSVITAIIKSRLGKHKYKKYKRGELKC